MINHVNDSYFTYADVEITGDTIRLSNCNSSTASKYTLDIIGGEKARLDGYDGTVRVYCPNFYIKSESEGTKRRVWISEAKIDDTWTN